MTIDEAIKHAEEVAEEHESDLKVYENLGENRELFKKEENSCKKCGEEHRQLAEWLKELKQLKEQEPCEDCVSRKRLMDNYNGVETPVGYRKVVDLEVIKNMPPVTPKRKTGKWVKFGQSFINPNKFLCYSCSECGLGAGKVKTKYCPMCGAEMEDEDDSN